MINIEKEFYNKINEKFGSCDRVAFHLTEMGALTTTKMEQYLIREEFKSLKESGETTVKAWNILADKYCKTYQSIRYILDRIG